MLYGSNSKELPNQGGCDECGTYSFNLDTHTCNEQQRLDHQTRQALPSFNVFEQAFHDWLGTPQGRFAQFEAARDTPA